MNPAEVAGLKDAAREAPRLESRTRKSEPEEFQTGTSVPVVVSVRVLVIAQKYIPKKPAICIVFLRGTSLTQYGRMSLA